MRAEDDVDALTLVVGPAREPLLHARGERLDQPGRVVVAGDVLEVDAAAVELEPVGHLLLVLRDRERGEVRREHEAHGALTPSSTISPTTSSIQGDQCRMPR